MTEAAVFTRLKGGLGNQMFQYAAGYALARRHNCPLKLDLSYFPGDPPRTFGLGIFGIEGPVASEDEIAPFALNGKWRRKLGKALGRPDRFLPDGLYLEPHFHFDDDFFDRPAPVLLDGYWQSERYFADCAGEIRDALEIFDFQYADAGDIRQQITAEPDAVSVHVRLGDYVDGKAASKMSGSATPDYYRRAVAFLDRALDRPTYFIFSDEPERAAELLDFVDRKVCIEGDPEQPADDLALMSACHHHIIANSSFSWWGAWLNPAPDKIVIAPRRWFSRSYSRRHSTFDIYPDGWLTLG